MFTTGESINPLLPQGRNANSPNRLSAGVIIYFFPALMAIFISVKAFVITDCYAYDRADDGNHTFPGLFMARQEIVAGSLPLMNLHVNFGTPILGDALTFPLSVQSLAYWVSSGPVAMMINRMLIGYLTMLLLIKYYHANHSLPISLLAATLAFLTPGALWHFAHHHYQLTQLCFVSLLLQQRRMTERLSPGNLLGSFALSIMMFFGLNVQLVITIIPFVLASAFLNENLRAALRAAAFMAALILAAATMAACDLSYFVESVLQSVRFNDVYISKYRLQELLDLYCGSLVELYAWKTHQDLAMYISLPVTSAALLGLFFLCFRLDRRREGIALIVLGIFPVATVYFLMWDNVFLAVMPMLRSADATRVLWIAPVFLLTLVAYGLDNFGIENKYAFLLFLACAILSLVKLQALLIHTLGWFYLGGALVFCLGGVIGSFPKATIALRLRGRVARLLCGLGLLLSQYPLTVLILGYVDMDHCRVSHYFSIRGHGEREGFPRSALLDAMEPGSRYVTHERSVNGLDFRGTYHNLFGGNGRTVFLDRQFFFHLYHRRLIEVDSYPTAYHFSPPWQEEELSRLGIRYVIDVYNKQAEDTGWRVVAKEGEGYLYENPLPSSLVYLEVGNEIDPLAPDRFEMRGNDIHVRVPPLTHQTDLVATFCNRRGWYAAVDGAPVPIKVSPDNLLRVTLPPGDHVVEFRFMPYAWYVWVGSILLSLGSLGLILHAASRYPPDITEPKKPVASVDPA